MPELVCPILSMGRVPGEPRFYNCIASRCAWWDIELNRCAILPKRSKVGNSKRTEPNPEKATGRGNRGEYLELDP